MDNVICLDSDTEDHPPPAKRPRGAQSAPSTSGALFVDLTCGSQEQHDVDLLCLAAWPAAGSGAPTAAAGASHDDVVVLSPAAAPAAPRRQRQRAAAQPSNVVDLSGVPEPDELLGGDTKVR